MYKVFKLIFQYSFYFLGVAGCVQSNGKENLRTDAIWHAIADVHLCPHGTA